MDKKNGLFGKLLPLAIAMFAVGTDGFVIAGLLPRIADDLEVGIAAAGQLVTAFALAFAVSAPILGAITSGLDRRRLPQSVPAGVGTTASPRSPKDRSIRHTGSTIHSLNILEMWPVHLPIS
ncbi:hypothetical protein [Amycolatopsis sp. cmx-11-51]|uniref:hypothetical protein n=1 Tax=unclassified Amycolatopsis TaxID=2618356 RepID=UPI0039E27315